MNGVGAFEFGIVVDIVGVRRGVPKQWYAFSTCGLDASPVRATGGIRVSASP